MVTDVTDDTDKSVLFRFLFAFRQAIAHWEEIEMEALSVPSVLSVTIRDSDKKGYP